MQYAQPQHVKPVKLVQLVQPVLRTQWMVKICDNIIVYVFILVQRLHNKHPKQLDYYILL